MSLTTDKTKNNFHCANLPKARKFYFIFSNSLCTSNMLISFWDCLTFLCYTPARWWWMCVYLMPTEPNLQTLYVWMTVLYQLTQNLKQIFNSITFDFIKLLNSLRSHLITRSPLRSADTHSPTLDFTTKIPNNAAFQLSWCISLATPRLLSSHLLCENAKLDSDKLSTAHSAYKQQS